jgi:hypothetical protein
MRFAAVTEDKAGDLLGFFTGAERPRQFAHYPPERCGLLRGQFGQSFNMPFRLDHEMAEIRVGVSEAMDVARIHEVVLVQGSAFRHRKLAVLVADEARVGPRHPHSLPAPGLLATDQQFEGTSRESGTEDIHAPSNR